MSGYPHNPSGYGYGQQPPPHSSTPYGGSAPVPPQQQVSSPYGDLNKPPKDNTPPYGSNPFSSLMPSIFPPGTDPTVMSCFQMADQDGSGFIDDKELQKALSSYNQSFGLRTVHLLMYLFTNTNIRKIGKFFFPVPIFFFFLK